MNATFGNGTPWEAFAAGPITLEQAKALATWFLVLRPRPTAPGAPASNVDDPTGGVDVALRRSPSGSFTGVSNDNRFIFRVRRAPRSKFEFISIGRNEGNDIALPDPSVSRFHAFLREEGGKLLLQDARSGNGTFVKGEEVPRQGDGPARALQSGESVRFGDIHGVVVDAPGLVELLRG